MKKYKEQYPEYAYVYIITDDNNYIKIGISKNPEKRKQQLQTAYPTALKILFTEEFYCTRSHLLKIENIIHKKVKAITKKVNGEWFKITDNKLQEIKDLIILCRIQYEDNEIGLKYGLPIL